MILMQTSAVGASFGQSVEPDAGLWCEALGCLKMPFVEMTKTTYVEFEQFLYLFTLMDTFCN